MTRLQDLLQFDAEFRAEVLEAVERLCDRKWDELPTVKPRARRATRATVAERFALFILAHEGDSGATARVGLDLFGIKPPD